MMITRIRIPGTFVLDDIAAPPCDARVKWRDDLLRVCFLCGHLEQLYDFSRSISNKILYFSAFGDAFFPCPVPEPEDSVGGNHEQVENIEIDDIVKAEEQLIRNACHISCEDDEEKAYAFSRSFFRCEGAIDGKWPGRAKTDQHDDFEYAHGQYSILPARFNAMRLDHVFC
jgi:hypothetical protein